jgi:hypothetical protein
LDIHFASGFPPSTQAAWTYGNIPREERQRSVYALRQNGFTRGRSTLVV